MTNDELRFLDDQHVAQAEPQIATSDEWIRQRTGIEQRRYVPNDGKWACSDLAREASLRAIADAGCAASDIDCIILGTLSPDIHFPGTAVFLQSKLGIDGENGCACYDIRQQCSGFLYGLQMADAFVRTGLYKRVLLVGAEVHSHSLELRDARARRDRALRRRRGRGGGRPRRDRRPARGSRLHEGAADGSGAMDLYLKVFEIAHLPYVFYDGKDRDDDPIMKYPQMNGKKVFLNAVRA